MNCNYELFYVGLKGLTNLEVMDEIYKKFKEYCDIPEEDVQQSTFEYKEKLRLVFDKAAKANPANQFVC